MAIEVTCECGKRLILKDMAAGKMLKCPDCKSVVQVPTGSNAAAQESYQLAEEREHAVEHQSGTSPQANRIPVAPVRIVPEFAASRDRLKDF